MRGNSVLTPDGIIVREMLRAGYTISAISKSFGVSRPSVLRFLKIIGVYEPKPLQKRKHNFTCQHCGKDYVRKSSRAGTEGSLYCCRQCAFDAWSERKRERDVERKARLKKYCAVCGEAFVARSSAQKLCSDECRKEYASQRSKQVYRANQDINRERQRSIARMKAGLQQYRSVCAECGAEFTYYAKHPDYRKFCSTSCCSKSGKRDARHRRRAAKKAQRSDLIRMNDLIKRDKSTCQICGVKVQRHKGKWENTAATIDHIIPISLGGPHTWDNVQLACAECNSAKRDSLDGVQLNLFVEVAS